MDLLHNLSFHEVVCAFLVTVALRETLIEFLPDRIAGAGGWLIDTTREEEAALNTRPE